MLLRMDFGSKEAAFLNAFVKVEKAPTLVVVDKGKVLEKLEGGVAREEFMQRLVKAVGFEEGEGDVGTGPHVLFDQDEDEEEDVVDDIGGHQATPLVETSPDAVEEASLHPAREIPEPPPQASSRPPAQVQSMLNERALRLEAEQLEREAAEKTERIARANARRKEAEESADKDKSRASSGQTEKQKARDAWIYQQKQRKDEAKKERERILTQIENDKQERKLQALRRKEVENEAGGGAMSSLPSSSTTALPSRSTGTSNHFTSALQIRLFDGTSIRAKFDSSVDIVTAVRTWVNEAAPSGGADIPYNFRQILAPQPSRTIEVSEEHQSLLELGLVPSATLVLVPVAGATDAYASGRGYMSSALHAAYYVANTGYSFLGSVLGYIPGFGAGGGGVEGPYMGGTGDEQEASNTEGARLADSDSASPGGVKPRGVNTLASQREESSRKEKDERRAEFYNGNSSAFEGRKDDDGDGK